MNFVSNPKRDAHATFAGFVFQVNMTILRWLHLKADEHLELEAGEDIDLIRKASSDSGSVDERLLEQLKQQPSRSLTLKSADALEAIANFCEHRKANPSAKLIFRFVTTASIGRERDWRGTLSALETWEKLRTEEMACDRAAITNIHKFLLSCSQPDGVSDSAWKALTDVLAEPDMKQLTQIISTLEWATQSGNHAALEADVISHLEKSDPPQPPELARSVYEHLFAFVFRLLCMPDDKRLTREVLVAELQTTSVTQKDLIAAAQLRDWIDRVNLILKQYGKEIDSLKARIPAERTKTFYDPESSSDLLSRTGPLFDFKQTLRGRQTRLSELDSFLNDPEHRIAVLPGRGGIGKTKLLLDWSRRQTAWRVLWVSQHGVWHDGSLSEIPNSDTLIVADDAHHYSDLDKLIGLVSSRSGEPRLKLMIATRPSGQSYIDELLARLTDESLVIRYKALRELDLSATVEIATEILGPEHAHLANWLADVSKDTPLITVVGGKLIVRGQVAPDLLANDEEFRRTVFAKFAEECTGQLPVGGRPRRELLELIAAVQPIDEQLDNFVAKASVFLRLRPDEIRKGVTALEQIEILVRSGRKLRIVPDLFADYLLETASVDGNGTANGFADAVFENFEESHLSNLLKNFAELDWRIIQSGVQSQLLENIWSSILSRFRGQNAARRTQFLRELKGIAVFQPANIQRLIRIAMDEAVQPVKELIFRYTQLDILSEIPDLLGVTIFNEETSIDAFDRLWQLSQHESDKVSRRAQKSLEDAIGYRKYKNVLFNERILTLVEKRAKELGAYRGDFTPLSLMDELLDREVDDTELKGRAFSISALPVNYEVIKGVRERALRIIDNALYAGEAKIAVRAVRSLASGLAEFQPKFRSAPTQEEQTWQDAERLRVLELLSQRLRAGNVPLQVAWKITRTLKWTANRAAQSLKIRESASILLPQIPRTDCFDLFDVLCTSEWEDNTEADGFALPSAARRDRQKSAIESLREKVPQVENQIQTIEQLLEQAVLAGIQPKSVDSVLTQMCADITFLEALSDYVLKNEESILASVAGIPVREWRDVDAIKYARYGVELAQSPNISTAGSVASVVCYGPPLNNPIPQDVEILTVLARQKELFVVTPVLFGLKRLAKTDEFSEFALTLITDINVGNDEILAKERSEEHTS